MVGPPADVSAVPNPRRGGPPGLSPELQRILAYASTIGSEFSFRVLAEAMGADDERLAEQLEELTRKGILHERSGGGAFSFVEEEVRAAVYRSMTETRQRLLHRKVAEVLEHQNPSPSPEVAAELGRHYFLGKVPAKSYEFNRRAANDAQARDDPSGAVHHLERALVDLGALEGDHRKERAEVAEVLGDLCYAIGRFRVADRNYATALDLLEHNAPRVRARLLLARAEVARENLDSPAARGGANEALRMFESEADPVGASQAHRLLGRVAFQEGHYREALEESMRALDTLPPDADLRSKGRVSIDIGNAFALLGEDVRPVAIEWYERAVERLQQSRDWVELARGLHNLGTIIGESRPVDGLEYLERARDAAERGHDARGVGRCLLSGVEFRLALGQLEEAERDNAQAGRLLERLTDYLGLNLVAKNAGRIAERQGQWDEALANYTRALDIAKKYRLTAEEAEAEFCLANLKFKTRDLDGARVAVRRAIELGIVDLSPNLAAAVATLARHLEPEAAAPGTEPAPATKPSAPAERPFA